MLAGLTGWHFLIIAVVLLVLFGGATRLPMFAKGLGQSIKIFRKEVDDVREDSRDKRRAEAAEAEREVVTTPDAPRRSASDDR